MGAVFLNLKACGYFFWNCSVRQLLNFTHVKKSSSVTKHIHFAGPGSVLGGSEEFLSHPFGFGRILCHHPGDRGATMRLPPVSHRDRSDHEVCHLPGCGIIHIWMKCIAVQLHQHYCLFLFWVTEKHSYKIFKHDFPERKINCWVRFRMDPIFFIYRKFYRSVTIHHPAKECDLCAK